MERDPQKRGRCNGDCEALGSQRMIISKRVSQGISSAGRGKNVHSQVAEVLSGSICSRGAEDSERRDGEMVWNKH